jgi:uncharacterized protein with HEPN domain
MPRDYRLYLDDILESCRKIRQFTEGMSFEEFERDVKTQDAVIRIRSDRRSRQSLARRN